MSCSNKSSKAARAREGGRRAGADRCADVSSEARIIGSSGTIALDKLRGFTVQVKRRALDNNEQWHLFAITDDEPVFIGKTGKHDDANAILRGLVGANGLIRLAPNTRVVAVDVIVVALEGDKCNSNIRSASRFTRADAEVWFDGRVVDAQQISVGLSDRQLSVSVLDRDPRPRWSEAVFNDAGGGRAWENRLMQDPDNVFSQCGARFGLGVQFRLRRFQRVEFDRTERCGEFADDGSNAASCMSLAASRAFGERDQASPALRIFIVRQHLTYPPAIARAYRNDIVVGLRDLETTTQSNAQNIIAHELGHALNPYNRMFDDGYTDPADSLSNLMRDKANRLTRAQCEASNENARGFLYQ